MDDLDGDDVGEVRVASKNGEHHMLYSWSGTVAASMQDLTSASGR